MLITLPSDPLSDVLSLLKPRSYMVGGIDVGGALSIGFPKHDGIKCYAVVYGEAWLDMDGVAEPVRLSAGDCFLLPRGWSFRLTSDLGLPPTDFMSLFNRPPEGAVLTVNGGGDCMILGSHFQIAGDQAYLLLEALPPIVHLRNEADRATLRWSMERMREELRNPQPGSVLMAEHLAQMMLVQALRMHLSEAPNGVGWLFALADRQMAAAIGAMHAAPAHRWTLQALAERAGMSRSIFAQRFKATVGVSPMDYLTRWRMALAGDRLAQAGEPVSTIALSLGYESESAFSTAFKRVMGASPRQYGRGRRDPAPEREAA
jgi:AraC-like DNA-binding protein